VAAVGVTAEAPWVVTSGAVGSVVNVPSLVCAAPAEVFATSR
jgi:hypothetical protein